MVPAPACCTVATGAPATGCASMDQGSIPRTGLLSRLGRFALGQGAALAALAVLAGGLLGFAAILRLIGEGPHRADEAILLALRRPGEPGVPVGPPWLTLTAREVTALGSIPVLALFGLIALFYLLLDRRWRAVLLLLLSLPGGLLLNALLKLGFSRPRPELVPHLMEVQTASFPSGHAMLSAITFLTLGTLLASGMPRRRHRAYAIAVAVLLALLVGGSRIWLGVHWPTDVAAGWCLGAAWAMACWLMLRRWRREERQAGRDGG
jgi:undecaprenyl-diphosphatase